MERSITTSEYTKVIRQFNDTAAVLPRNGSVHGLFEAQVERTPHAIALVFGDTHVTYGRLNIQANQVAHALLARGMRAEDRVGIYADRSLEMIVGMLAVLKSGGAYVPLDPRYPPERLTFMSDDSALVAILTTATLARQLPIEGAPVILLDQDLVPSHEEPRVPWLTTRDLAYIMYTSGSTGLPKGVLVEHRCVLRLVINSTFAQIGAEDCVVHCASPSFDAATWEVWGALLNGARMLIISQRTLLSPTEFCRLLVDNSATAMFLTVGLFNEYVDALERAFGVMRHLLVGGDKLSPAIVARALAKPVRPKHLLNAYGPTETTTFATTFEITGDVSMDSSLPIGGPISNTQIYILDSDRSPVPVGVMGEIFVGGPGVARGYLQRPELTAEKFVPDPFSSMSGAVLYRTGDMGSWQPNGSVAFVGRRDSQLKIRGFRVEPGEIEMTLQRHPSVKQGVVIARQDERGLKHLIAYVVVTSRDSTEDLIASIRGHLTQVLPSYMVPAAVFVLDKFPLTHNGKVDRDALPAPSSRLRMQAAATAQTSVEMELTRIWEKVLKLAPVGIDDNFFELGGDSMMGLELISQVGERLILQELSVVDLLEHPTAREMAQLIESLGQTHQSASQGRI